MAYKNINGKVMYATLRGTGKLGNARLVDKVQLMRCKQSPYLNYSHATVQQHDMATLRQLKSSVTQTKRKNLIHETLSLMDRPDKIHLVDYGKVSDDLQKLTNDGIQEDYIRQGRAGTLGAANNKLKSQMNSFTKNNDPNRKRASRFKRYAMDSCKGGLSSSDYEHSYVKKPVVKKL